MNEELKKEIPTENITLTKTGVEVVFYKTLTSGESRLINKMALADGHYDLKAGTLTDIPAGVILEMQDKMASFLIKGYLNKEREFVPFTPEWLANLPAADGEEVYNKVNAISQASNLTPPEQKK